MGDATQVDIGLALLRVLVGLPLAMHGAQKLFGWFSGGGFDATARWFEGLGFGRGRAAALMAGSSEICGGVGLAFGLLTPLAAAAMIGTMTTAALVNNDEHGFWSADKGWELNGYLVVVAAAVAIAGPGLLSLDHALGLDWMAGWWGAGASVVAIALGWLRWATRSTPDAAGA